MDERDSRVRVAEAVLWTLTVQSTALGAGAMLWNLGALCVSACAAALLLCAAVWVVHCEGLAVVDELERPTLLLEQIDAPTLQLGLGETIRMELAA